MVEPPAILLIEDEPLLLQNLQILLQHEGYRVRATCDGAAGIKQLKAESFDLVITDLVMPGIDGFQVLDSLGFPQQWSKKQRSVAMATRALRI
jgi:DNA-binding response OmpR family regulator